MTSATLFLTVAAFLSLAMGTVWLAVARGAKSGWTDAVWSFLVGIAGVAVALAPIEGWPADPQRSALVALAAALWSLRLGFHIVVRTLGGGEWTRPPSIRMAPEDGVSSPAIRRSNVDLPQPERPTTETKAPSATDRSTGERPTTSSPLTLV